MHGLDEAMKARKGVKGKLENNKEWGLWRRKVLDATDFPSFLPNEL
jgi:hypothetical protein